VPNKKPEVQNMKTIKQRITDRLRSSTIPLDVENIRVSCKIGNWNTALKHCLELVLSKEIKGQKTSKGWIFWINQEAEQDER